MCSRARRRWATACTGVCRTPSDPVWSRPHWRAAPAVPLWGRPPPAKQWRSSAQSAAVCTWRRWVLQECCRLSSALWWWRAPGRWAGPPTLALPAAVPGNCHAAPPPPDLRRIHRQLLLLSRWLLLLSLLLLLPLLDCPPVSPINWPPGPLLLLLLPMQLSPLRWMHCVRCLLLLLSWLLLLLPPPQAYCWQQRLLSTLPRPTLWWHLWTRFDLPMAFWHPAWSPACSLTLTPLLCFCCVSARFDVNCNDKSKLCVKRVSDDAAGYRFKQVLEHKCCLYYKRDRCR